MMRTHRLTQAPARWRRTLLPPGALLLLGALVLLGGCTTPMVKVENLSQVGPKDVLIVGRVELVPPLKPGEQDLKLPGPYNDENQLFFFVNSKPTPVAEQVEQTPYEEVLATFLGETFYVKGAQRPSYFTVSFIYMTLTRQKIERVWLPGGFVVAPQPGDRAIYIGTVRYHRNEFFDLEKVELVDDFAREQRAFRTKFGGSVPLVKRLARVPKG